MDVAELREALQGTFRTKRGITGVKDEGTRKNNISLISTVDTQAISRLNQNHNVLLVP